MEIEVTSSSEKVEDQKTPELIQGTEPKLSEAEETPLKCSYNEYGEFELKAIEGPQIKEFVGVRDNEIAEQILKSSINTLDTFARNYVDGVNLSLQTLHDQKPKDAIEARLITQAGSLYANGMDYLAMANKIDSLTWKEYYANLSIKLLRLHNETVAALNRYRKGGEQKVTVVHITQQMAISNNFEPSGGGGANKTKEQVHDERVWSESKNQQK